MPKVCFIRFRHFFLFFNYHLQLFINEKLDNAAELLGRTNLILAKNQSLTFN